MPGKKKKGPGRGGKRAGAGRKREIDSPVKLTIVLEQEQVAWLDAQAAQQQLTRADFLRALIDEARR